MNEESILKDKHLWYFVIPVIVIIVVVISSLQIFLVNPINEKVKTLENEFQTEKEQIEIMSCSQLHDGLLHNTIQWSENVQRATERYVAGCESK